MASRKFPRSGRRSIIFIPELLSESDEYVVGCFSKSALAVARKLIADRGFWITSYASSFFAGGYDLPNDIQMDQLKEILSEFLEDTNNMNCDDFIASLTAISNAILTAGSASGGGDCCEPGSFGAGTTEPTPNTFEDDGVAFPPEFADRTAYETYKCQVANAIIASIEEDMAYLTTANILALGVASLALALVTPIPFDDIAVLLGLLVAWTIQAVLTGYISAVEALWTAQPDELVCRLFIAANSTEAKSNLRAYLDTNLSSGAAALAKAFVGFADMNGLFGINQTLAQSQLTMGVDCDDCTEEGHFFEHGGLVDENTWESELGGGGVHQISVAFYASSWTVSAFPTRLMTLDFLSFTGFTPKTDSTHAFRARTTMTLGTICVGWDVYCQDATPGSECMKKLSLRSTTPFTVDVSLGPDC